MIRPATIDDSKTLTDISFTSKGFWGYPESYFDIWNEELTITEEYISKNHVIVIEVQETIIGYYSIVLLSDDLDLPQFRMEKGIWLEHLFIRPEYIGHGYGAKLMVHLLKAAAKKGWSTIKILADPNSKLFYEKLEVTYIKDIPSNIEGRSVCYFEWEIEKS